MKGKFSIIFSRETLMQEVASLRNENMTPNRKILLRSETPQHRVMGSDPYSQKFKYEGIEKRLGQLNAKYSALELSYHHMKKIKDDLEKRLTEKTKRVS